MIRSLSLNIFWPIKKNYTRRAVSSTAGWHKIKGKTPKRYEKQPFEMFITGPIIFVEDDSDDQYIFEEACRKLEVSSELKFFRSAEPALSYLRQTNDKPFIIFCDINMTGQDGLQLRRTINEEEHLRQKSIPFVFFSTAAAPSQVRKAYDLTVQGFFLKEQRFDDTVGTIRMILEYWKKCYHPNRLSASGV